MSQYLLKHNVNKSVKLTHTNMNCQKIPSCFMYLTDTHNDKIALLYIRKNAFMN